MTLLVVVVLLLCLFLILEIVSTKNRSIALYSEVTLFASSVRKLYQSARFGASLPSALLELGGRENVGSRYLNTLVGALTKGLGFPEGVRLAQQGETTVLDGFVDLVCGGGDQSHASVIGGLEKVNGLLRLILRNLRQEKARTKQSRMQFWVIAVLVPCLFVFTLVSFPQMVTQALDNNVGILLYGSGVVFYLLGIALFLRLQGRGFAFFVEPAEPEGAARRAAKASESEREALRLGFLSALELALHSGMGLRKALHSACQMFPHCEFSLAAERVLQLEGRGELLDRSFRILDSDKVTIVEETLIEIGKAARERNLLCQVVSEFVLDTRENLQELAEEQVGIVSVQLLFPLCLGMLPAALLVMLAPVIQLLAALL